MMRSAQQHQCGGRRPGDGRGAECLSSLIHPRNQHQARHIVLAGVASTLEAIDAHDVHTGVSGESTETITETTLNWRQDGCKMTVLNP